MKSLTNLRPCPDCGGMTSTRAAACPHCGRVLGRAPSPQSTWIERWLCKYPLLLLLGTGVVALIWVIIRDMQ